MNPTWKADFYGDNYAALLAIKRKWDPNGVFWCRVCVGSDEDWEVVDGPADEDPMEWAVGQVPGKVCRREGSSMTKRAGHYGHGHHGH